VDRVTLFGRVLICAALGTAIAAAPRVASAQPQLRVILSRAGQVGPGVVPEPEPCIGPLTVVPQVVTVTNGDSSPVSATFTTELDPGLSYEPGNCVPDVGTCTILDAHHAQWSGTLDAHSEADIFLPIRVDEGVPLGTRLCETFSVKFDDDDPFTVVACLTTNSARQCGVGAPALGRSGLALLVLVLLAGGVIVVRRRAA